MFPPFSLTAEVRRFEGPTGWTYVPFDEDLSRELRPLVTDRWPALLKVRAGVGDFSWTATVMPIKDGPLFIALTAPVRKRLDVAPGQTLTVRVEPL